MEIERNPTREVSIGSIAIGGQYPLAVQSMTATATQDIDATVQQIKRNIEILIDKEYLTRAVDSNTTYKYLA